MAEEVAGPNIWKQSRPPDIDGARRSWAVMTYHKPICPIIWPLNYILTRMMDV